MYNILICDDERDIVSALKIYLGAEGYGTFCAYTGKEALDILAKEDIHLVLMDIMMPVMDGIDATVELRKSYNLPVILLTAKSEDTDKILGLNIGADDYVTKPFNPVEVLARVRSQLRRYTQLGSVQSGDAAGKYTLGGITLCDKTKEVTLDGEPVTLTPMTGLVGSQLRMVLWMRAVQLHAPAEESIFPSRLVSLPDSHAAMAGWCFMRLTKQRR